MKKKNNIICPLCGSNQLVTHTHMKVEDPVNHIFVIKKKVKTCSDCGMTIYYHANRGWEGCVFNHVSGHAEYYMNNREFINGVKENLKLQKNLPKIVKSQIKQFVHTSTALPETTASSRKNIKNEDIYYYKSSLQGITVLS